MSKLTPMEQAMMWERMSGERLPEEERERIMQGGEFHPPEDMRPLLAPTLLEISAWCEKHLANVPNLPCRVDEMTSREYRIFNEHAARSLGFIIYLQNRLANIQYCETYNEGDEWALWVDDKRQVHPCRLAPSTAIGQRRFWITPLGTMSEDELKQRNWFITGR